jgi:REP element-mobilizing transposase RayT
MARTARLVVPGVPPHIAQRGNRRQRTFFTGSNYEAYTALMARSCTAFGVKILAYRLMPNHVHLVAKRELGSDDMERPALARNIAGKRLEVRAASIEISRS